MSLSKSTIKRTNTERSPQGANKARLAFAKKTTKKARTLLKKALSLLYAHSLLSICYRENCETLFLSKCIDIEAMYSVTVVTSVP